MPTLRERKDCPGQYHIYTGGAFYRTGPARWGGAWTPKKLMALNVPPAKGTAHEKLVPVSLSEKTLRILTPEEKKVADFRLLVAFQCHYKGTTMYKGAIQHIKKGHIVLLTSFADYCPDVAKHVSSTEPGYVTLWADMVAFPFFWTAIQAALSPPPILVITEIASSRADLRNELAFEDLDAAMALVRRR